MMKKICLAALCAIGVLTACEEDTWDIPGETDDSISFAARVADEEAAATRGEDRREEQTLTMTGALDGKPVFLHEEITAGIDLGHTPDTLRADTRGKLIEDNRHFHSTMNVYAYTYAGTFDASTANVLMDRLTVRLTMPTPGDEHWYYAPIVRWPDKDKVKFFAYSPDIEDGSLSVSAGHVPTLTYALPSVIDEQKDLMVAAPIERDMALHQSTEVDFAFRHLLSAVRFKVKSDISTKLTVKSLRLEGLKDKATFRLTDGQMDGTAEGSAAYTLDLSESYPATKGFLWDPDNKDTNAINKDEDTFLVMPQTCAEGAQITAIIEVDGIAQTLTADLKGTTWEAGYTYTYSISNDKLNSKWEFEVESSNLSASAYTFEGGQKTFTVKSLKRTGSVSEAWAWQMIIEQSYDNGATWEPASPDVMVLRGATGSDYVDDLNNITGSLTAQTFRLEVGSGADDITPDAIKHIKSRVREHYDLSTHDRQGNTTAMNTANCYIVNGVGTYRFPLVYGNAIKNGSTNTPAYKTTNSGNHILKTFVNHLNVAITDPYIYNNATCTPKEAAILWQDANHLLKNVQLVENDTYIEFTVDPAFVMEGNSIVGVKDSKGDVMWSWHIWVTDRDIDDVVMIVKSNTDLIGFTKTNMGWTDPIKRTFKARKFRVSFQQANPVEIIDKGSQEVSQQSGTLQTTGSNLYYQYGRKDPSPGATFDFNGNIKDMGTDTDSNGNLVYQYDATAKWEVIEKEASSLGEAIKYPNKFFYYGAHNWYGNANYHFNLWNVNDTDDRQTSNNVIKTIYDPTPVGFTVPRGDTFATLHGISSLTTDNVSYSLHGKVYRHNGQEIFFPSTGTRDPTGANRGKVDEYNVGARYATATSQDDNFARCMYWVSDATLYTAATTTRYKARGYSVRPIMENDRISANVREMITQDYSTSMDKQKATVLANQTNAKALVNSLNAGKTQLVIKYNWHTYGGNSAAQAGNTTFDIKLKLNGENTPIAVFSKTGTSGYTADDAFRIDISHEMLEKLRQATESTPWDALFTLEVSNVKSTRTSPRCEITLSQIDLITY